MPSMVPRYNASNKRELLEKRERALRLGIQHNFPMHKLAKLVHEVRLAQIAVLKAELHWYKVKTLGEVQTPGFAEEIKKRGQQWADKTIEQIIQEYS